VGVGWNYVEYDALGQDFSTRGRRADEQIDLLRRLWSDDLVEFSGEFDAIDRATLIPRPMGPIPVWVGGFSEAAFRRGATLGDGFMYAGTEDRVMGALDRVRELGAREIPGFGHDFVALRSGGASDVAGAAERWSDAGGTHFSVVSMGLGFDSVDAHLDFMGDVARRLALPGA
jgi:alkanesulfonate monooxygenase SsuD/methylene tetrahydromethanopterin reductase-like flavin-dependent oxidoreductase (luciferase family)